jgi:hypothetical protein
MREFLGLAGRATADKSREEIMRHLGVLQESGVIDLTELPARSVE